ncbi:MAG: hypothetical protein RSG07_06305 [Erysipelotrichaceae bacterium]
MNKKGFILIETIMLFSLVCICVSCLTTQVSTHIKVNKLFNERLSIDEELIKIYEE